MELTARHAFAYPFLEPADLEIDPEHHKMGYGDAFLMDDADAATTMSSAGAVPPMNDLAVNHCVSVPDPSVNSSISSLESETLEKFSSPTISPLTSYCDDRLCDLRVDQWSRIPVDNTFAASAISLYLESEHPLFGLFDPDLFLNDLIACKSRFCSSLLVNSLLYRACVSQKEKGLDRFLTQR